MKRVTPQPIIGNDLSASLLDRFREYSVALNQCADHRLSEFVPVVANYTAGQNDHVIECAPSGAMTVTLPAASVMRNKRIVIKRTNNTTHTVTIQSASGHIDDQASVTLTTAYQKREVFSDGANWWLLDAAETDSPVDECFGDVVLLLHFDGSNGSTTFTDSSSYEHSPASVTSTAAIDTGQSKFGGSSGNFTGGYIQYADSDIWDTGDQDFCVEAWVMFNSTSAGDRVCVIGAQDGASGGDEPWAIVKTISDTLYISGRFAAGGTFYAVSSNTVSVDTWYHVALVRNGTSFKLWVDGAEWASTTGSGALKNVTGSLGIGIFGDYTGSYGGTYGTRMMGWLDEVRFTIGCARYTGAFDVPTEAFPNQ